MPHKIDVAKLSLQIPQAALPQTVRFENASGTSVVVAFFGTPPFNDQTNPFTVNANGFVDRTIPAGAAAARHNYSTNSGRTGDIDIV